MRPRSAASSPRNDFETILSALDGGADPEFYRPVAGMERLWPSGEAAELFRTPAIEGVYADNQQTERATPVPSQDETADFAKMSAQIAAAGNVGQLRNLRRAFALAAHPDRVPPQRRAEAERLMAKVNAAIDSAMIGKGKGFG
jgi:hypothetical protein